MGVRKDDLTQYIQQLETLKADISAIMSKIAAGEELQGISLAVSAGYRSSGDAHALWLYSDGLELLIFDRDSREA